MTIKTLTGHYTGGYTLSPAYTGVHVSYNASVAGYHPVLSGDGGAGLTLTFAASLYNAGVIVGGAGSAALSFGRHNLAAGQGGAGASVAAGGAVSNVLGYFYGGAGGAGNARFGGAAGGAGILAGSGVSVFNFHSGVSRRAVIAGGAGGDALALYAYDGGAGGDGVDLAGGSIINQAAVIVGGRGGAGGTGLHKGGDGGDGVVLSASGSITNAGFIISAGAVIKGGGGGDAGGQAGRGGTGVVFQAGGTVTNAQEIDGGNGGHGSIGGAGATGLILGADGVVNNDLGHIRGGQSLSLAAGATILDNSSLVSTGTVVLAGSIGGSGILTVSGGSVDLAAGAAITVGQWALTGGLATVEQSLTFSGGFSQGAAATMTIALSDTLTLAGTSSLAGIVNGAGSLAASAAAVNGLTVGGTATLIDTGTVTQTGGVTIGDASSAIATLSIGAGATWTINGAVGIARGAASGSRLQVAGTLIKSGASGVSVVGLAAFDTGLIEVAGGTLDFQQAITGTGALRIDAGAILEVDSSLAKNVSLAFNGAATLALKNPTKFAATIGGFAIGDTIDLLKIAATGASINAKDQLVIVNGATTVATLKLSGVYSKAKFAISSDGHGGTRVTLLTLASSPPSASTPHAFAAAMAGLGGGDSGSAGISPAPAANLNAMRLLAPGVH